MDEYLGVDLYHIVIHDRKKEISMEKIKDFIENGLKSCYYLVSLEKETENKHYHILVRTQINKNDKQNRPLRNAINDILKVSGKGNLSTALVRKKNQLMKYVLKDDGEIIYKGIPEQQIKLFKKLSIKKADFASALNSLEEEFFDTKMTPKMFARKYVKLQIDYGYNMRPFSQTGYILKMVLKRDENLINGYVDNLFRNYDFI